MTELSYEEVKEEVITEEKPLVEQLSEFLKSFKDRHGRLKYKERIKEMILLGKKSLVIDFEDLLEFNPAIADKLIREPDEVLKAFSDAIRNEVSIEDPKYAEEVESFIARIRGIPEKVRIRDLRSDHVGKLISIDGILVKATPPKQLLYKAVFKHIHPECNQEFPWPMEGEIKEALEKPPYCPKCLKTGGSFKLILEKSKFRDWQKVTIQERPEELPAGQIPRSIDAILLDDIVDAARPGDRVTVTGVLRLYRSKSSKRVSKPVFDYYLDVNYIEVSQRVLEEVQITPEDELKIKELAKDPLIRRKIVASIAPTIHGLWPVKEAIALQLFGGNPKIAPDGTRIRGDIHILLIGDPGVAKSLTYSEHILLIDCDGKLRYEPIGKLVDYYFDKYRKLVRKSGESEVLKLPDIGTKLYTFSINPITLEVELKPIKALIRHKAPPKVVLIKTRYGRRAILTKDHSLVALVNGILLPVKPEEVAREKLPVPILRKINIPSRIIRDKVVIGKRIIELNEDVGYFIGYFIGHGTIVSASDGERVEIRSGESRVIKRLKDIAKKALGINEAHIQDFENEGYSKKLVITDREFIEWLKNSCFKNAYGEHALRPSKVPEFSYVAPVNYIIGLITGLIDSIGTLHKVIDGVSISVREVRIGPVSKELAYGITVLLSRLGVTYTISPRELRHEGKDIEYYELSILDIEKLLNQIPETLEGKLLELRNCIVKKDVGYLGKIPLLEEDTISVLRYGDLANSQCRLLSPEAIGEIHDFKAVDLISNAALPGDAVTLFDEVITWDIIDEISEVDIKDIEVNYKYVYDISVEDNENFVGGLGLIFLHNSQLLQFVARIAPRAIFTTGKGSTAAGLTAAVVRDKMSGEFVLEAGALVLADGGIACLHPETKVFIDGKLIPIKELFNGVKPVKAYSKGEPIELIHLNVSTISLDTENGLLCTAHVSIARRKRWRGRLLKIVLSDGNELMVTPDHLLIDGESLKWREAREFKVGGTLLSLKDNDLRTPTPIESKIVSIEEVPYEGYVYDLYVPNHHNFVANGVIVHNCIDEIDKMRDEDRVVIHEAMEQQVVSIAKAGIVARLNARTSILAAGNPKRGRYNRKKTLIENTDLPPTILSRFDLIFVITDEPQPERDRYLALHIAEVHGAAERLKPPIDPDLLRKYIAYARKYVRPKLTKKAREMISEFYVTMRKAGGGEVGGEAPIAITARQLEALIRLAEAHAKMALKEQVTEEDVAMAIQLMKYVLDLVGVDVETGAMDIDVLMTGSTASQRRKLETIEEIIGILSRKSPEGCARIKDIIELARKYGISEDFVTTALRTLRREGTVFEPRAGCYAKA